ncbi:hypothetical protein HMPREF1989_00136 [Porphyromonas gingivalis F0566]|nr:hypothetical protein HMPREF1989_00136 [Porphyromonas gingivalis F0566]
MYLFQFLACRMQIYVDCRKKTVVMNEYLKNGPRYGEGNQLRQKDKAIPCQWL